MSENPINQIARQLWAMGQKKRESMVSHETMANERFQRTFTDENYPERARPGFKPLPPEQKKEWEQFHTRGEE